MTFVCERVLRRDTGLNTVYGLNELLLMMLLLMEDRRHLVTI